MDDETMSKVIAHYMPDACAGKSCPAPEIWATVINEDLPASECARLDEHAQGCPYCTAERRLAQEFIDMPQAAGNDDVAWIVDRVAAADKQKATNVVELRPRRHRILPSLIGLAAAAMLVLAFAPMLPLMQPALEVPVIDDVTRGTRISALQPAGELAVAPSQLQWSAAEAAVRRQRGRPSGGWRTRASTPRAKPSGARSRGKVRRSSSRGSVTTHLPALEDATVAVGCHARG